MGQISRSDECGDVENRDCPLPWETAILADGDSADYQGENAQLSAPWWLNNLSQISEDGRGEASK